MAWIRVHLGFLCMRLGGDTKIVHKNIHRRAYLSIGVISSTGPGPCGVSGGGDSRGAGPGLCRILDMRLIGECYQQ